MYEYLTSQAVNYCACGTVLVDGESECASCQALPKRCCPGCDNTYVVINDAPLCAECLMEIEADIREEERLARYERRWGE